MNNRPFDTGNSPLYWCAKHKSWHTPGLPYTCQEEETTVSACKYRRPCNCCPCGHCDCFFGEEAKCCECEEVREPLIVLAIPEKCGSPGSSSIRDLEYNLSTRRARWRR